MKNLILVILFLSLINKSNSQTIIVNNGITYITLSNDYNNVHIEENTPIVISNTNTVEISGDFLAYGSYDQAETNSYDIVIIAQTNTSIGVVKNISPESMDPTNGTTVIRTSTGGAGLPNPEGSGLYLFPNPVTDILNIEVVDENITLYEVFDLEGELVLFGRPENKKRFNINLESFETGTYILKVNFENGKSKSLQFIKN